MVPALLLLVLEKHIFCAWVEHLTKKMGQALGVIQHMLPKVYKRLKDIVPVNSHALRGVVNLNGPTTKKGTDNFCQVFWEIGYDVFECS